MSKNGAQTVKPLPIKSMAALRNGVWAGSLGDGGASTKCVRAIAVSLARLLLPGPKWRL